MDELINFKLPRWDELPDFDIYMDQVVSYINTKLKPLASDDNEKIITSTMVNNYVKNSMVKPPIKKHYKRYHVAFLIAVTILKRVYSLSEISKMIEIQKRMENSDLKKAYDSFGDYLEKAIKSVFNDEAIEDEEMSEYQLLLFNVVAAVALKLYAEIKIEEY